MEKDINERFGKVRIETSLNKQQFADSIGIPSTTVSDIELGKREPSKDVLLKLASKYGVNLHWMLTGQGEMYLSNPIFEKTFENASRKGLKRIPVYSESELPEGAFVVPLLNIKYSAGEGSDLPEEEEIEALIRVPAYLSRYGDRIKAIKVEGDSMYPTLSRGDIVVCDAGGFSGEGIYAVQDSGAGLVKRITKAGGKFVLISDNLKYPPREVSTEDDNFSIIGRAHCAIKRLE